MKSTLLRAALVIGILATTLVPASSAQALVTTNKSTQCYALVIQGNDHFWGASSLAPSDKGFKWLYSQFAYVVILKGTQYKQYLASDPRWYWYFAPSKFAITGNGTLSGGGATEAESGGNPSGKSLGSRTSFKLYSSKSGVDWAISFPWAVTPTWYSNKTVRVIQTNTNLEPTKLTALSGVLTGGNPIVGGMGGSGLYKIGVSSSAFPSGDAGAYSTTNVYYKVSELYRGALSAPSPSWSGLTKVNCSKTYWSN